MLTARLTPALLAALLLACGPKSPDSAGTESTGAASETGSRETTSTSSTSTTTTTETTSDVATTTSGVDPLTGTGSPPNPTMSDETTGTTTGTTAVGPCVADPAAGLCTEGCDAWNDCCQCDGQEFFPDPMASECVLAMGIVTATCPWNVDNVYLDDEPLPGLNPEQCAAAESGWYQEPLNGDIVIHLCGQSCADYLAGNFKLLRGGMYCEAA